MGWPDVPAGAATGKTVRDLLDYIAWITESLEPLNAHEGPSLEHWRKRVQAAYDALVDAMAPGHGDPFPPDVPPHVQPGAWPDVPSGSVPGVTVRHQLAAIRAVATQSRANRVFPHSRDDIALWTDRVVSAYDALDHGPTLPMPESARTAPPPPPAPPPASQGKPPAKRARRGGLARTQRTKARPSRRVKRKVGQPKAAKRSRRRPKKR